MALYTVSRYERWISYVEVEAESEQKAIEKVEDGEGNEMYCEYVETLDPEGEYKWSASLSE